MARPLVAANWKMFKDTVETGLFFQAWAQEAKPVGAEVAFFPPFPLIPQVISQAGGAAVGAQNCHEEDQGAFTGEVSCALLKDLGCAYVLVGHSERRHVFCEPDGRLALKFRAVLRHGMRPILCVGEKLGEREAGETLKVVERQLALGLGPEIPTDGFDIAYEPVWAIGTGKVAKPEDADEVHKMILAWLTDRKAGRDTRILYGGSVKADNAPALMAVPSIHGLLVGGASLDPTGFAAIARAAEGKS
jgi:triosephosphate isomerase